MIEIDREALENRYKNLSEALAVVMAQYPDVMIFDRGHNSATTVKLKDKILGEHERSAARSYSETWNRYIASYVEYEDRSSLLMSVENETIYAELLANSSYSHTYRIKYNDTPLIMQVTYAIIHADKDYIVFGFKNIT